MITGDHPLTAMHIARQLKIADDARVLTGQDLERMNGDEIKTAVETTSGVRACCPQTQAATGSSCCRTKGTWSP